MTSVGSRIACNSFWKSASGVLNLKPAKCFLKYAHPISLTNASSLDEYQPEFPQGLSYQL